MCVRIHSLIMLDLVLFGCSDLAWLCWKMWHFQQGAWTKMCWKSWSVMAFHASASDANPVAVSKMFLAILSPKKCETCGGFEYVKHVFFFPEGGPNWIQLLGWTIYIDPEHHDFPMEMSSTCASCGREQTNQNSRLGAGTPSIACRTTSTTVSPRPTISWLRSAGGWWSICKCSKRN